MLERLALKITVAVSLIGTVWMGIETVYFREIGETVAPYGLLWGSIAFTFFFLLYCVTPKKWWDD